MAIKLDEHVHLFSHPAWIEWVCNRENLVPAQIAVGGDAASSQPHACLFSFARSSGKLRTPRLQPYLAGQLETSETSSASKIGSQRLELLGEISRVMKEKGLAGGVNLPAEFDDVRPWQWDGFRVEPAYTYFLKPREYSAGLKGSVRNKLKKAHRQEYRISTTPLSEEVVHCLHSTEQRRDFSYGLTVKDLDSLRKSLPDSVIRCYVASTKDGEPISSRIVLLTSSKSALDWVAGTVSGHYSNGVTQMLIARVLDDLAADKIDDFDFGGANIPSVAKSKSYWGGELKKFYQVSSISARSVILDLMRLSKKQ